MLVEGGSVKKGQAVGILREVGGNPIHEDPYARLMEAVHEVHEIVGRPVPARHGKVTCGLVAPRLIQGMLAHGQELHVGVAHLLHVRDEDFRELPIGEPPSLLFGDPSPGAQVHLVDRDRATRTSSSPVASHPLFVRPLVFVQVPYDGGAFRPEFRVKGVGIGFLRQIALVAAISPRTCISGPFAEDRE